MLIDEPSVFVLLATIEAMQDGPSTLRSTALLFRDAAQGGFAASIAGMTEAEAARWSAVAKAAARAQLEREAASRAPH